MSYSEHKRTAKTTTKHTHTCTRIFVSNFQWMQQRIENGDYTSDTRCKSFGEAHEWRNFKMKLPKWMFDNLFTKASCLSSSDNKKKDTILSKWNVHTILGGARLIFASTALQMIYRKQFNHHILYSVEIICCMRKNHNFYSERCSSSFNSTHFGFFVVVSMRSLWWCSSFLFPSATI